MPGVSIALFVAVLLGYAVVLNLYLVAFFSRSQKLALLAGRALAVVWGLHSAQLVARWIEAGHPPLAGGFDVLSFFGWCLALLYLVMELATGYRMIGAFVTPVVLGLLATSALIPKDVEPLAPVLHSGWLPLHVSASFLAYAALTLAAGDGSAKCGVRGAECETDR